MAIEIVASGTTTVPAGSSSIFISFATQARVGDIIFTVFNANVTGYSYDNTYTEIGGVISLPRIAWKASLGTETSASYGMFSPTSGAALSYIIIRGAQIVFPALYTTTAVTTSPSLATISTSTILGALTGTNYSVFNIWSFYNANTSINAPTGLTTVESLNATTTVPGVYIGYEANQTAAATTARTLTYGASATGTFRSIVLVERNALYYVNNQNSKAVTSSSIYYTQIPANDRLIITFITNAAPTALTVTSAQSNLTISLLSSVALNNTAANGSVYVYSCASNTGGAVSGQLSISSTNAVLMSTLGVGLPFPVTPLTAVTSFGSSTLPSVTKTGLVATNNYFMFGIVGSAGPQGDTFTQDTLYYNTGRLGTTGGNATTNRTILTGGDNLTGVTSDSYNPTLGTSRPWGAIILAYQIGTVQTADRTEAGTATDTETSGLSNIVSITEAAPATDTQNGTGAEQVVESVTATDSESAVYTAVSTITETGTATETETAANTTSSSITETSTATETETAANTTSSSITETVTTTDVQAGGFIANSNITETGTAIEAEVASNLANVFLTESAPATNTQIGGFIATSAITESAPATETETAGFSIFVSIYETTGDILSAFNILVIPDIFTYNTVDTSTATLNSFAVITETSPATESEIASLPLVSVITESVSATDLETAIFIARAIITESVSATDSETGGFIANSVITETGTATDAQVATFIAIANITESGFAVDTQDSLISYTVFIKEEANAGVTSVAYANFVASINETVNATDLYVALGWFGIDVNQAASWVPISNTQAYIWNQINNAQPSVWTKVQNNQPTGWTEIDNSQPNIWINIDDNQ